MFAVYISVSHVCDEMGIDSLAIKRDMRRKGVAGAPIRVALAQQKSPPHGYL